MQIVVIDDISIQRELLADKTREVCTSLALDWTLALSTGHWQDVERFAATAPADTVYLLDIQLEDEKNGIELRRRIHELDPDGYIVYISAYEEYALECCQSHAFDFLLKPWTTEQLRDCIHAIHQDMERRRSGPHITITMGSRTLRLQQRDILYLSKEHNNVTLHLESGDTLQHRASFGTLLKQLSPRLFIQCHKSYIVQSEAICEFNWADGRITLTTGEQLPISRRRMSMLQAACSAEGSTVCK